MIYRKIFIKTKEDLPKVNNDYIVRLHPIADDIGKQVELRKFNPNNQNHINWWKDNIDWYLLPIEEPTDEEIENAADIHCLIPDDDERQSGRIDYKLWVGFVDGAKAMRDNPKAFKK